MKEYKELLSYFLCPGELHMIAGVKGVGKTMLLLGVADELAENSSGKKVFFYYSPIVGEITIPESSKITFADVSELLLQTGHFFLDAHFAMEDGGIAAVIIDDYQFLLRTEAFRGKDMSRQEKVLYLLTRLKSLAEAHEIPVIVSTAVDDDYIWGRANKRPLITDIPDHTYVEAFVDRIILMHREDLFSLDSDHKGIAELRICELATGRCWDHQLAFLPEVKGFCVIDGVCGSL